MTSTYYTCDTLQPPDSVGYLVKRCGTLAMQIAEQAFELQPITFTQWIVLARLREHPHITPTDLSNHIGHDMGAMTRVVDILHRKHFVRRQRSEEDRRAVRISITPAGRRVAKMTEAVALANANRLVEIYTKTEIDVLVSLLQRLQAHMERSAERPAAKAVKSPRVTATHRRKSKKEASPRAKSV